MSDILVRMKRLFRLRFAVIYPLAIYLVFFTTPDSATTGAGLILMAMGMALRLWSNGYAIKLDKLTTSGPYAFVRNPLYVGTGLILLGVAVMLNILVAGVIFFAALAAVYTRTIRNEERMLTDKFGAAYLDYRSKVPAMWPALCAYAPGEKWPFCLDRLWFSREHKVVLWLGVMVIGFQLKKYVMINGWQLDQGIRVLIGIAGVLVLLDVVGEFFRPRQKKA